MILDYLIIKLYILSIAVVQYELLSCSSLYIPFIVFSILIVQSVWTPYCLSIHSLLRTLLAVCPTWTGFGIDGLRGQSNDDDCTRSLVPAQLRQREEANTQIERI